MFAGFTQKLPFWKYVYEVRNEVAKVTWPTRQQTIQKTTLVVTVSVIVGLYIGLLDSILTQVTGLLLK